MFSEENHGLISNVFLRPQTATYPKQVEENYKAHGLDRPHPAEFIDPFTFQAGFTVITVYQFCTFSLILSSLHKAHSDLMQSQPTASHPLFFVLSLLSPCLSPHLTSRRRCSVGSFVLTGLCACWFPCHIFFLFVFFVCF